MREATPVRSARRERTAGVRTVLAFDFGLKRIGIAVGDTLTASAAPRPAALVRAGRPDWSVIEREVSAAQPNFLVIGVPFNADGSPGVLTEAARSFGALLGTRFGLAVEQVDERWSSLEASAALARHRAQGQRKRRVRSMDVDSAAAAIILERWLAGERQGNADER
ncbi:MAG TPA: Holliday junction resolvase RuvX [Steroidobacteraceae bacterium]|nr:Holliday junction resolvase RuvX [Steroidobacteraceae bacterium]